MHLPKFLSMLIVALLILLLSLTLVPTAGATEYKVLYKFQGGADGQYPSSDLIFDGAGNLYGTTDQGGTYDHGTVFKLTPNPDGSWTETVLYSFTGNADGNDPIGSLIFDAAGNLYGTTAYGGSHNSGTVFKLSPNPDGSWGHTALYSFRIADGAYPDAGVIFDAAGNLYGTTYSGGYSWGTVFKLAPNPDGSWSESVIHNFAGYPEDGDFPHARLVFDAAGNLYGTTTNGGAYRGGGTAFRLIPRPDGTWSETVIHNFNLFNGRYPMAGLTLDAAGNLYGTTVKGGAYGKGTAFKLTPQPDGTWKRSKLHVFKGTDGAHPYTGLIFDAAGNLYGTTYSGGDHGGTVFKLHPNPDGSWTRTKLHTFHEHHHPTHGLVMDTAGNLYGTTPVGGGHASGVVFKITP